MCRWSFVFGLTALAKFYDVKTRELLKDWDVALERSLDTFINCKSFYQVSRAAVARPLD